MDTKVIFDIIEIILIISLGIFIKYTSSYSSEKGRNLATREDIAEITRKVEGVRSEYAMQLQNISHQNELILEQGNRRHQLKMAALDRRLQAHQEAYALWWDLFPAVNDQQEINRIVLKCQDWWKINCLYLEADAREAFNKAYIAAHNHHQFIDTHMDGDTIKKNWKIVMDAGKIIVKGVELPPISETESNVSS